MIKQVTVGGRTFKGFEFTAAVADDPQKTGRSIAKFDEKSFNTSPAPGSIIGIFVSKLTPETFVGATMPQLLLKGTKLHGVYMMAGGSIDVLAWEVG